jgi:membrane AbrB-like protein
MLLVVLSTVVAGAVVAWLLGRFGSLPGSSAAWGSSPGGASAMVSMAEEFGADPRIVAFMQYARVVCVVVTAALVARFVNGDAAGPAAPVQAARPESLVGEALPILATLALAIGGGWLGRVLRVPAGGLLGPMILGAALHAGGLLDVTIPEPLLALSYACIGWYVGLRFTKPLLASLWRAVPQIVGASMVMIALGAVSAWLLIRLRHTDPLTAFLATTPGGIDSVAIIAVGTSVDVGFVMALQTLRVLVVILTGAPLARFIARTSRRPDAPAGR